MIVVNENSLIVAQQEGTAEGEYEEVFESLVPTSRYSSFKNQKASTHWGIEETKVFYKALSQCGTNFSLLQSFLPNRTRNEIKNKFHREEKAHPELINNFIHSASPLDITPFNIQWGEDIMLQKAKKIVEKDHEIETEKETDTVIEKVVIVPVKTPEQIEREKKKREREDKKRKDQENEEVIGMLDSDGEESSISNSAMWKISKSKKRGPSAPLFAPSLKK